MMNITEISKAAHEHLATFSLGLDASTSVDLGDRVLVEVDDDVLAVLDQQRASLRTTQPSATYSDVIMALS